MAECLCLKCAALCCRYFALPIDNPSTAGEFDDVRWYLCHENVVVFIEEKQWYLGITSRCKHLQADNRCGIYETRPRVCRSYSTENCDYHGGEYNFEKLFTSAEQLAEYAREILKANRAKKTKARVNRRRGRARVGIKLRPHLPAPAAAAGHNGDGNPDGKANGKRVFALPLLRN